MKTSLCTLFVFLNLSSKAEIHEFTEINVVNLAPFILTIAPKHTPFCTSLRNVVNKLDLGSNRKSLPTNSPFMFSCSTALGTNDIDGYPNKQERNATTSAYSPSNSGWVICVANSSYYFNSSHSIDIITLYLA